MQELQQIRDLSKSGMSQIEISHYLKIGRNVVSKMVGDDIISLRESGKSLKEIISITGYSKGNVSKWINKTEKSEDIKQSLIDSYAKKRVVSLSKLKERRTKRNEDRETKSSLKASINRKKKRYAKKKRLVELCGGKCCNCGYDKHTGALDFHHIDESLKLFSIRSNHLSRPAEDIAEEVNKCALLCANCHREVHLDEDVFGYSHNVKLTKCEVDVDDIKDLFK